MLSTILALSIVSGLFFKSFNAFLLSLFVLFLYFYPLPTLAVFGALAIYGYFSSKGNHHE